MVGLTIEDNLTKCGQLMSVKDSRNLMDTHDSGQVNWAGSVEYERNSERESMMSSWSWFMTYYGSGLRTGRTASKRGIISTTWSLLQLD